MPPTNRVRNPSRFTGANSRRMRVQGGIPAAPAPAPVAPVAAEPVNPYQAIADTGASNTAQYESSVRRSGGGGPSPLEGVAPVQHPDGGPGSVINPFDQAGQRGAPISREQYQQLQGQFGVIHRASPTDRGKAYNEQYVGAQAGGDSFEVQPMRDLMRGNMKAVDDPIIQYPESMTPTIRANVTADRKKIRDRYTKFRTANSGSMSLEELFDLGDDLAMEFRGHNGFIRNLLQEQISRDTELNNEFQEFKLSGEVAGTGNELFRTQFDPAMQKQIMAQIGLATAQGGGFIMPQLAETLGLQEDDVRGGYKVITAAGESVPATADTIADLANRLYGIGGAQPAQPAAAVAPDVTVQPGALAGAAAGPEAEPEIGNNGVSGIIRGQSGNAIIQFDDGVTIDLKNEAEATAGAAVLRERGKPDDLRIAAAIDGVFNTAKPPLREGEVRVERQPTGPVSTAADISAISDKMAGITPTPEEAVELTEVLEQAEQDDQDGNIRKNKAGDTIIWDPITQKFLTLLTAKEKRAIAKAKKAGGEAGIKILESIWGDKNPVKEAGKFYGNLSIDLQEANKKNREEAFKAQE